MNNEYLQFKKKNPPKYNREKPPQTFDDFPSYDMMGGRNNNDDEESAFLHELERFDNTPLVPEKGKKDSGTAILDPIRIDSLKLNSSIKLLIRDVTVYFPFEPYDCQVAYMTSVIDALNGRKNALLQSPTGTGKTLCLLCATLGWVNKYREGFNRLTGDLDKYKPIKIYYSSRTHSQIKQVVKELKQTCYRPVTSILGSRNQLCVRPDFSDLVGFQLNSACKAARTTNIPEQRCYYYDNFMRNKNAVLNQNKNNISDIEELVSSGKKSRFCPYFLEREIKQRADLIFLPYNYLLDSKIRETMEVNVTDSIVIFDEAHNVEGVAEEGSSFAISLRELENCEMDFKLLRQKMRNTPEECKITENIIKALEYPIYSLGKNMTKVKKELEKEFKPNNSRFANEDNKGNKRGKVCAGREIFDIFKGMTFEKTTQGMFGDNEHEFKSGLDQTNFQKFLAYLQVAVDELANVATSKGGLDAMQNCATRVWNLLRIDLETKNIGTNKDWCQNFIESYVLYIHFDEDFSNFNFSLWCLNPGVGFSFIKDQKPLNILLTSGTLTPLKSFESELLVDFPVQLVNNHVIDTKNQCYTVVLRKGPANYPLNFSYERRNDVSGFNEMGTTLINIARLVPNGILVCFASYSLMQNCFDAWQSQDQRILSRLEELKKIHREPKKANQLKVVMSEYMKDAKTKGAILFCVCRGKVSEGIDFSDEMARAVVVIGVPFPPIADVKVQYKKQFLDTNKVKTKRLNGNEWYMQQTIRACNQAIGRVIRHVNDYGIVFLCDERFSGDQFRNEFPNWIKDNLEVTDKFGFMVGKVATFFKDRNKPAALSKLISKAKAEIVVPALPSSNDFNNDPPPFEDKRSIKSVSVQSKNLSSRFEEETPLYENREIREIKQIQRHASQMPPQNFRLGVVEETDYKFEGFKVRTISPSKDLMPERNPDVRTTSTTSINTVTEHRSFKDVIESQRKKNASSEPPQFGLKRIKFNTEEPTYSAKPSNQIYIEPTPIPEEPSYENSMSMTGMNEFRRASDSMHSMQSMNSMNSRNQNTIMNNNTNRLERFMQMHRQDSNRSDRLMPMEEEEEDVQEEERERENFVDILTRPNRRMDTDVSNALTRLLSAESMESEVETQLIPESLERSEPTQPRSIERSEPTQQRSFEATVPRSLDRTETTLRSLDTSEPTLTTQPKSQEREVREINHTVSALNLNIKSDGKMSAEKTGAMCIMCYEKKTENIMTSACGHLACNNCWENWLKIKSECPTCKKKVRAKQLIKIHF